MNTLRQLAAELPTIPTRTSWYLAELAEAKGRQELFNRQMPQKLKVLREHALIESAISSNRIEGVEVDKSRIGTLMFGKPALRDRDEEEVRGYRDALKLIHESGAKLPITEATIKKLHKLTDIGERERVDVILTNPPFGGEEEKSIQGNFPEDKQTAETALLFLQLIMRKLRRQTGPAGPARAGVVVPNGTLFGDGVCARIKEELLKEFNLHTIVRLPNGVFAPYTGIPTNLLFFDRSGPTRDVWYYEQPLPEGRKNYTKTAPIQFEEFAPLVAWWNKRKETDNAWKVPAAELLANGCNLDRKNPRAKEDITHLPPAQLAADILKKEQRIAEIMGNIQKLLAK